MKRITNLVCALCLGAAVAMTTVPATTALAKKPPPSTKPSNQAVSDCYSHGRLTRHYTKAELRTALAVMPAYVEQYSNCQSVLQAALAGGSVKANGSGGGGGGSSISTPLIIVIVVVVLAIVTFGGLLIRRRRGLTGGAAAADQPTQVFEPETRPMDDRHDREPGGPAP